MEKNFIFIMVEILIDVLNRIRLAIESNLMNMVTVINVLLPYVAYISGQYLAVAQGKVHVGVEVIIIFLVGCFTWLIKEYANKIGKGITVPIPQKRFTEVGDDGEVTIEHDRIHELILYVADLEDWLERKGLM